MEISVKLPVHNHPLYPSSRFVRASCSLCGELYIHGGYRCNDSECEHQVWFHKECADLSQPKINHLSHPKHPLLLTHHSNPIPSCDLCGVEVSWIKGELYSHDGYSCSACDFNLCLLCSRRPPPLTIEHPMFHEHRLVLFKDETNSDDEYLRDSGLCVFSPRCKACNKSIEGTYTFACFKCFVYIHVDCIEFSPQVSHPSHPNHPLVFIRSESLPDEADKTCIMCGIYSEHLSYHCNICNFTLCLFCGENSPPLAIDHPKTHQHQLTLLLRRMSFTCNVCGMEGDRSPYLCLPCGFMVHRSCIDLPRVININRHDHRIYLTHHIGPGYLKCGVCRRGVSQYYGAYTCSICPAYVVHSHCAMGMGGHRVWDGIEIEGVPEDTEDISPFRVVAENLIIHFSHEQHNMILIKDGITHGENTRCEACVLPVWSDPVYNCESCNFVLHETCANLPRKKRHVYHAKQFTLHPADTNSPKVFNCVACETFNTGFKYEYRGWLLDAKCGSFVEPFVHGSHSHPLYYDVKFNRCHACLVLKSKNGLCCDDCEFFLCFTCAQLPTTVKHICDAHPLSLCFGENVNGEYWCDICEGKLDSKRWFYTCSDCRVTVHMKCVLGEFAGHMPGRRYKENMGVIMSTGIYYMVVPNSHSSRPLCSYCRCRCTAPFILKICDLDNGFICSRYCMYRYR